MRQSGIESMTVSGVLVVRKVVDEPRHEISNNVTF